MKNPESSRRGLPSYDHLACRLLNVDVLPLAPPRMPWHLDEEAIHRLKPENAHELGYPIHYPGALTEDDEQALRFEVCRSTGLSPAEWPTLPESDRLVWMRLALDRQNNLQRAGARSGGFVGGDVLGNELAVRQSRRSAFFKQLERKRRKFPDDAFKEVENPSQNSPRFLYRTDAIEILELAKRYQGE